MENGPCQGKRFAETIEFCMPLSAKQLEARARWLAAELARGLERDATVEAFLEEYARRQHRPKLAGDADRYADLVGNIRREALLVMLLPVLQALPRKFAVRRGSPQRRKRALLAESFREELLTSVARELRLDVLSENVFRRDLDLYRQLSAKPSRATGLSARSNGAGPFADRCAMLVDPSMLEEARRAAAQFQHQLQDTACTALTRSLRGL